jgi:hypothetical protein
MIPEIWLCSSIHAKLRGARIVLCVSAIFPTLVAYWKTNYKSNFFGAVKTS